jgi:hypothetical protein
MTAAERQIGICGTFDVENYGDLLFPLIVEAELSRRLGRVRLHRFSYTEKTTPIHRGPGSGPTSIWTTRS